MCGTHGFVVDVGMGFGRVIRMVEGAGGPVVTKLALGFAAAEPPEAHVHGFHFARDDSLVGYAKGCSVIGLDGRFWLRPTHFNKGVAERDHFFGTDVETGKFGFCGRGGDKFDDLGDCEN